MKDKSVALALRKDGSTIAVYKETSKSSRLELIEKGNNNAFACVSLKSEEEIKVLRDFINSMLKEGETP